MMNSPWSRYRYLVVAAAAALLVGIAVPVMATGGGGPTQEAFERRAPDEVSPSGHSVLADCQAEHDGDPEGWVEASAELRIRQSAGQSRVVIRVRNARPDTYFTVWLRLGGTDSAGSAFGGNPLTGGKATPLAASWSLQELLESTGSGNGNDHQPNGFRTNHRGNATFRTTVDFPIDAGAYPFHRFPDWDPTDERLPADDTSLYPVAIAGPQGPYTLRIVSHCTDDIGHGLTSGPRQWWFDWTVAS